MSHTQTLSTNTKRPPASDIFFASDGGSNPYGGRTVTGKGSVGAVSDDGLWHLNSIRAGGERQELELVTLNPKTLSPKPYS